MGDFSQIERSPLRLAYWGQLAALLTTAFVLAYLSWSSYRDAIARAETTSSGIARVNAFALDTTLNTADMLLAETAAIVAPHMADRAALDAAWREESRRLRLYLSRIPQLNSVRIFNAAGQPRTGFNQAECLACHKPKQAQSYLFLHAELAAAARKRLVRQHFGWLARSLLERALLWHASPERLRGLIRVEGDIGWGDRHRDRPRRGHRHAHRMRHRRVRLGTEHQHLGLGQQRGTPGALGQGHGSHRSIMARRMLSSCRADNPVEETMTMRPAAPLALTCLAALLVGGLAVAAALVSWRDRGKR